MKAKNSSPVSATVVIAIWLAAVASVPANALFGGGDVVFDPTMFASQLQQLQQETATVTNLAQQLQYAIQEHDRRRRRSLAVESDSAHQSGRSDQSAGRALIHRFRD